MSYHAIGGASGDGGHVVELEETFPAAIQDVCNKELEVKTISYIPYLHTASSMVEEMQRFA
jgi:hypothetical protein